MKAKVTFDRCVQDSQEYGSDDEHMVSRVFLTLEVGGRQFEGLEVDIKQAAGSSFETGTIEVGPLRGYNGPFNYTAFRDEVETYYRELVGAKGKGIQMGPGTSNARMRNNTFITSKTVEFDVPDSQAGW